MRLWALRVLLAALLVIGSELLLARDLLTARPLPDLLLLIPGYLALATLLLDFASRYRVRDLFGVLLLAGTYALVNGLAVNPTLLGTDPLTLVTRTLGGHMLVGLAMLVALLWAARHGAFWLGIAGALFLGALAGGLNLLTSDALFLPSTLAMLASAVPLICTLLLRQNPPHAPLPEAVSAYIQPAPLHNNRDVIIVLALLAALAAYRLTQTPDITIPLIAAGLLALCWAMLWYQHNPRYDGLLARLGENGWRSPLWWVGLATIARLGFLIGTMAAPQIALYLATILTAVGLVWLPTVALVIALRALRREARALRL
jgi:hypothetical protein